MSRYMRPRITPKPTTTADGMPVDHVKIRRQPIRDVRETVACLEVVQWQLWGWRFDYSYHGDYVGSVELLAPSDYKLAWLIDQAHFMVGVARHWPRVPEYAPNALLYR